MALVIWTLLLSIPLPFVWAGPASSASLTPYITNVAPKCSHSCLQSFIARNYPTQVCTAQNLNCLCITPSTTGFTLGEAALTCLYSSCKQEDTRANSVYDICEGIPGAQTNTHTSLTDTFVDGKQGEVSNQGAASTMFSNSRSTKSSSLSSSLQPSRSITDSGIISTTITSRSSTPSSSTTPTSSHTPSSNTATSDTSFPTAVTSASASSSSPPPPSNASLTKPQIVGVVIASVGAAALAFGFCFFLICYRRRRRRAKRRPSDTSWIGDKIPSSQGSTPDLAEVTARDLSHHAHPAYQVHPVYQAEPQQESKPPLRVVTPSQGAWKDWPRNTRASTQGIGLAIVPEMSPEQSKEGPSPITPYSYRTDSQLLPDRPHYGAFPPPTRKLSKRYSQSLHPPIPTYAPEKTPPMTGPRFPGAMDTSQANLQGVKRSMSDPFYAEQRRSVAEGYRGLPYTPWTNPSSEVSIPPTTYQTDQAEAALPGSKHPSIAYIINEEPKIRSQQFAAAGDRPRSQKYPPRKKSASSSNYTRFSNDSATSFEDIDDDQSLPKSALPPVTEIRSPPRQTARDEVPPLPVKSARRTSTMLDRPHPTRRGKGKGPASLAVDTQSPVSGDVTQTAKWKILVSPGLQSLEESLPSSPQTPRTPTTAGKTPPMPMDKLPRPAHRLSDFR